jgi:hypothetical protein
VRDLFVELLECMKAQMNRGADIFLADAQGKYIGRAYSWRESGLGVRRSCDSLELWEAPLFTI